MSTWNRTDRSVPRRCASATMRSCRPWRIALRSSSAVSLPAFPAGTSSRTAPPRGHTVHPRAGPDRRTASVASTSPGWLARLADATRSAHGRRGPGREGALVCTMRSTRNDANGSRPDLVGGADCSNERFRARGTLHDGAKRRPRPLNLPVEEVDDAPSPSGQPQRGASYPRSQWVGRHSRHPRSVSTAGAPPPP
jgi:hypothetical protein